MKIIITGACGHIGSYLVENIKKIRKIKKVILIDNFHSNNYRPIFSLQDKNKFSFYKNNYQDLKIYIFGKNNNFFIKDFKKISKLETSLSLKSSLRKVFKDIKNDNDKNHKTILFSPAAASFDSFKNFEDRGIYFNNIIKKLGYVKR